MMQITWPEWLAPIADWSEIAGFPVGIVALIVAVYFARKAHRSKRLALYFLDADQPVVIRTSPEIRGKLKILYDGQDVENLFVVTGALQNTGTEPLPSRDMVDPIVLGFEAKQARFLQEPVIVDREPANVSVDFVPDGDAYRVDFPLLNGGDRVTFRVVASGQLAPPKMWAGRYEGLSQIETRMPANPVASVFYRLAEAYPRAMNVLILIAAFVFSILMSLAIESDNVPLAALVLVVPGLTIVWLSYMQGSAERRRRLGLRR